jgi:hypothetical protein
MTLKFGKNIDRIELARTIESSIETLKGKVRIKLGKILTPLVGNMRIISGVIEIDIDSHLTANVQIKLADNELEFIQSLVLLRKEMDSAYSTSPEIMNFYANNEKFDYLINEFDSIIHNTQRMKGILNISADNIDLNIDLSKMYS